MDEYSSEDEDNRRNRKKKKSGSGLPDAMKSEIWKIMGRDPLKDRARDVVSDEDESDMEATGEDLWREERMAFVSS